MVGRCKKSVIVVGEALESVVPVVVVVVVSCVHFFKVIATCGGFEDSGGGHAS